MAKSHDAKKNNKKAPLKTAKEKKLAKQEKKASKQVSFFEDGFIRFYQQHSSKGCAVFCGESMERGWAPDRRVDQTVIKAL